MKPGQRILCLWLPRWPLERFAHAHGQLNGQAILLYEVQARGGGLKVTAYTPAWNSPSAQPSAGARPPTAQRRVAAGQIAEGHSSGIRPGMPLAEALALHEFAMLQSASRQKKSGRQQKSAGAGQNGAGQGSSGRQAALHLEMHDPGADRLALAQLAETCQQFSPIVGLEAAERPAGLLLDITGLAPLFGGEKGLAEQLGQLLTLRGLTARLAVADTIGAAWAMAHFGPRSQATAEGLWIVPPAQALSALALLPLAALRLPPETEHLLAELGVERIEQLCRLPRASLDCRFGPALTRRLDQAQGTLGEVIEARRPPAELEAHWLLEYPTDRRDIIATLWRQLLPRLVEPLAAQRRGVLELACRLDCPPQPAWHLPLTLFRPSASVEHLLDMLQLRLESLRLTAPVTAVRIEVLTAANLEYAQQELFTAEPERGSPAQVAQLVDRLSSRLGRQAVLAPRLLADAQPEHACQYIPLAAMPRQPSTRPLTTRAAAKRSASRPARSARRPKSPASSAMNNIEPDEPQPSAASPWIAGERPLELLQPPLELAVISVAPDGPPLRFCWQGAEEQVARYWGPERIETGWWRSRCVRRDYYRVETPVGRQFWIFRRLADGCWFMQGTFA